MSGKFATRAGRSAIALAWLMTIAACHGSAHAGSFKVNPVQLSLPDSGQAASLSVTNSDAVPVSIKAQVLNWNQVDGTDRYSPASNAIVSPPIFTIAPGATQLVRIALGGPALARAYRVMLSEIPRQKPVNGQVQVVLRLNLPLYVEPAGAKPAVTWRAWRSTDGSVIAEARNAGTAHQQVTQIAAEQDGRTEVLSTQMGVVLPGSARLWQAHGRPALQPGSPITLIVKTPTGETETRIQLEPR